VTRDDEVLLGIAGCRRGASFARVSEVLRGVRVTAVMDPDEGAALTLAQEVGDASAFTEFERFLDQAPIDAVVVASPIHLHAEQSVAALERNIHVLSEVPACDTLEDARALADAADRSRAIYMLGENSCYMNEQVLVRRMARAGCFGELLYGEAEYLHDCRDLWRDGAGELTWRARTLGTKSLYITHSLGPILEVFDDRVVALSAFAYGSSTFYDPEVTTPVGHVVALETSKGAALKVRIDNVAPRPSSHFYLVQGTAGAYESARGLGEEPKVWLAADHEESHVYRSADWHDLFEGYAEEYIPERLHVTEEKHKGGHGASEYWMLQDFVAAIREGAPSPIGIYRGLDYTVPGIVARQSAEQGGVLHQVPDFRPQEPDSK